MIIVLNASNDSQESHQFMYTIDELETGLDFLNCIIEKGDILLNVDLIEDNKRLSLPVEAFDGTSFSPVIKRLKAEWVSILSESIQSRLPLGFENTRLYKDRLSYHEQNIINLELLISDISRYCEETKYPSKTKDEAVTTRYQALLKRYTAQLEQSYLIRGIIFNRLQQFQA